MLSKIFSPPCPLPAGPRTSLTLLPASSSLHPPSTSNTLCFGSLSYGPHERSSKYPTEATYLEARNLAQQRLPFLARVVRVPAAHPEAARDKPAEDLHARWERERLLRHRPIRHQLCIRPEHAQHRRRLRARHAVQEQAWRLCGQSARAGVGEEGGTYVRASELFEVGDKCAVGELIVRVRVGCAKR